MFGIADPTLYLLGGRLIYVDTFGSDAKGRIGRPDLPFLSVSAAIACATLHLPTATLPILIKVGAGQFAEKNQMALPAYVSLVGSGIDVTIIRSTYSSGNNCCLAPGTNSTVSNLTLDTTSGGNNAIGCFSSDTLFTGATLDKIKVTGQTDCIMFAKACTWKAYDCEFTSNNDVFTSSTSGPTLEFWHCKFASNGGASASAHAFGNAVVGTISFHDCVFSATNANASVECICVKNGGATLNIYGATMINDRSGTTNREIANNSGTCNVLNVVREDGDELITSGTITPLGWGYQQTVAIRDAGTGGVTDVLFVKHNSTGTPGTNFGTGIKFFGETDTTEDQDLGALRMAWSVATHASRVSYLDFLLFSSVAISSKMRLHGSSGLSVGHTTDPGSGIISANTGFWVGTAASTTGKLLQSDGSKFGASTMTWPSGAAPTARKMVVSDGTNMVASTELWPVPGAAQNSMSSNGTDWTAVAQGAWDGIAKVSGSDFTTTSASLVAITGLTTGTLVASTLYEFEVNLYVNCTGTAGLQMAIGGSLLVVVFSGQATAGTSTTLIAIGQNTAGTATATFLTAAIDGVATVKGFFKTNAGSAILVDILRLTSGTAKVYIGSIFKWRKA